MAAVVTAVRAYARVATLAFTAARRSRSAAAALASAVASAYKLALRTAFAAVYSAGGALSRRNAVPSRWKSSSKQWRREARTARAAAR